MHKVFVYGTLKTGEGNNRIIGRSGTRAYTSRANFRMRCVGFPMVFEGGGIEKFEWGRVVGELFTDITDDELAVMDRLERHPTWYRRKYVQVVLPNGEKETAWMYIMQGEPNRGRIISPILTSEFGDNASRPHRRKLEWNDLDTDLWEVKAEESLRDEVRNGGAE